MLLALYGHPMRLPCSLSWLISPELFGLVLQMRGSCLSVAEHGGACLQHAPEPPIKDPAQDDASKADALRIYSMEDVEKHDTRDSAWFVHKGQVWPSDLSCQLVWKCHELHL